MFEKIWKTVDDRENPLLGPICWILQMSGLILSQNKMHRYMTKMFHGIFPLFTITLCMELYITRDSNINEIFNNLRILTAALAVTLKAQTFILQRDDWISIIEYVIDSDKHERETESESRAAVVQKYTTYCHRITFASCAFAFLTYFGLMMTPFIFLASPTFREQLRNDPTLFPYFFGSWVPFDKYTSPGTWITLVWQMVMSTYAVSVYVVYDVTVIVIMVFFGGKLELICDRCKRIVQDGDAETLHVIAEIHYTHTQLLKCIKLFDSLVSPVMFVFVMMCSFLICVCAVQVQVSTNSTYLIMVAEFLTFCIAELFMFCWHSNYVYSKFEKVMPSLYESDWYIANAKHRKNLLLLMGKLNIKHTFSAGPFTVLNLPNFITILKGAYSFYTLLRK